MSTGGGGPPPFVGYSQQAAQYPPPQGPPQPPQQQQQAQAATAANPDVFVRRLYKPRLQDQPSLGAGVVGQLASLSKRGAAASTHQQPQQPEVLPSEVAQSDFLLSPALALPEEFGKIYLGETFSAYVSIVNTLPHPILLLEAHASLKSSRSSEILLNNMAPLRAGQTTAPLAGLGIGRDRPRELRPGENLDVVVEHVLQELDWHYLAVKLEFLDARGGAGGADGPPRPMMKRFKFKVYNPVAITTTHRQIASSSGGSGGQQQQQQQQHHAESEVLIQAQVKNITERHTSLMLEDVAFVAEDGFVVEPLRSLDPLVEEGNSSSSSAAGGSALSPSRIRRLALSDDDDDNDDGGENDPRDCVRAFDRHVYLQPDDVVQFLYRLRRAESYKGRAMVLAAGMPLGQLRVSWRTTLGEAGTLLSPRVLCSAEAASAPRPVELRLEGPLAPPEVGAGGLVQGEVYTAQCAVVNNTERDLWLQVQFHLEAMQGVYVTGKAFQNAGLVPAHTKRPMAFQLLPLMAGLHEVKGVTIVDMVTSQEFHQDRLCEVMVVRREEEDEEGDAAQRTGSAGLVAVGSGLEHVLGSN